MPSYTTKVGREITSIDIVSIKGVDMIVSGDIDGGLNLAKIDGKSV